MFVSRLLCLQIVCLTINLARTESNYYEISINQPTVSTIITAAKLIPTLPPGYTRFPDIRTAYKVSDQHLDWWHAREACIRDGANLAVTDTWTKVNHVKMLRPWLSWVWTGIYREPFGYSEWKAVHGGWITQNLPWSILNRGWFANCVALSGLAIGALEGWSCNREKLYVCEIPDAV